MIIDAFTRVAGAAPGRPTQVWRKVIDKGKIRRLNAGNLVIVPRAGVNGWRNNENQISYCAGHRDRGRTFSGAGLSPPELRQTRDRRNSQRNIALFLAERSRRS